MEGLIIKILSNQCEIKCDKEVVVCQIRGKIRHNKLLPLVGDKVIINKEKHIIEKILPRKNELRRPSVSNVTQGLVVASLKKPDLDTNLIDKILVELEFNNIKPIICFTKRDLLNDNELKKIEPIVNYYSEIYPVYFNDEIDKIKKIFQKEITVFVGQTGAGKSTLLNKLDVSLSLSTNEISEALGRGKHTTRHVELLELLGGEVLDTPGFSALEFPNMLKKEIRDAFIEFANYPCLYRDCMHIKEENCQVIKAVQDGKIMKSRYQNYLDFVQTGQSDGEKYKRR